MQVQSSPVRLIPLSRGLWTLVDAADFADLSVDKWTAAVRGVTGGCIYALRSRRHHQTAMYMHRVIMGLPPGRVPEVDHINGDGLDNRRCNLRLATKSQNQCNRALQSNNKSGYRGVSFNRAESVWYAYIKSHGRTRYVGRFYDPVAAAHAWDVAALKFHGGEFARLNFPP